jgi:tetratricopeptide (TPR) repeat protein
LLVRHDLAHALHESGRDRLRTIELAKANLEAQRELVGKDHPAVLHFLRLLATAYGSQGFELRESDPEASARYLDQVEELLDEAADVSRRHFGEHAPHFADVHQLRGAVRFSLADWEGARRSYGEARRIFAELDGYEDEAANALMYLGLIGMEEGDVEGSIAVFEDVLREYSEIAGSRHQRTAVAETNLAEAYYQSGLWEPARRHFESALDIHLETLGAEHWRTARIRLALADSYLKLSEAALDEGGTSADARAHFDRANELYQGVLEEGDEERQATIERIAQVLGG